MNHVWYENLFEAKQPTWQQQQAIQNWGNLEFALAPATRPIAQALEGPPFSLSAGAALLGAGVLWYLITRR
jgi:hypothetical protein